MKIAGIIAEYNPFHNGHAYHIEQTRMQGATHIVAVMSGSFVQRGDIAVCSKWARAEMAMQNGVDLVVELPTSYVLSSANRFANAGVYILNQLGAKYISFGSENGDLESLESALDDVLKAEQPSAISPFLKQGMTYPTALSMSLQSNGNADSASILDMANNTLGIEYLRAIRKINNALIPIAIEREKVYHDSDINDGKICSASYIRKLLCGENAELELVKKFMPSQAFEVLLREVNKTQAPISSANIEAMLLYRLRTMTASDFSKLPDVSDGLENRLYSAAQKSTSLDEFYDGAKAKCYTQARIRRIAYHALLAEKKPQNRSMHPEYIRVLGTNSKGMEIIAAAKAAAEIPIRTKFADLYKLVTSDKNSSADILLDVMATDIFALAQKTQCNQDFTRSPIVMKQQAAAN